MFFNVVVMDFPLRNGQRSFFSSFHRLFFIVVLIVVWINWNQVKRNVHQGASSYVIMFQCSSSLRSLHYGELLLGTMQTTGNKIYNLLKMIELDMIGKKVFAWLKHKGIFLLSVIIFSFFWDKNKNICQRVALSGIILKKWTMYFSPPIENFELYCSINEYYVHIFDMKKLEYNSISPDRSWTMDI